MENSLINTTTYATSRRTNPYILAGATKRWHIVTPLPPGAVLRLIASTDAGNVDQPVRVVSGP